jgi:hypothetical protein
MTAIRLITDDQIVFFELMTYTEENDTLVMRAKHFDGRDLTGWEEKDEVVTLPLSAIVNGVFQFEGFSTEYDGAEPLKTQLKMSPDGDDRIKAHFTTYETDGTVREDNFIYNRVTESGSEP